jgi:hypothetical protein
MLAMLGEERMKEEYCLKHYLDKLEFGQCWRCKKEEEE